MIDRIVIRFEKGKGIIETETNDAFDLLKLALEHGLIDGGCIASNSDRWKEERVDEKERITEELKDKIPSVEDIIVYILSQDDFRHTTCDIHKHFFGRELQSRGSDKVAYNTVYRGILGAHKVIEKDYDGTWDPKWEYSLDGKKCRLYIFIRNGRDEIISTKQKTPTLDNSKTSESFLGEEKLLDEPEIEDVRSYILSKGIPFEHSMSELTEYFFGRRLYEKGADATKFNRFYRKMKEVRSEVARQYQGHWIKVAFGRDRKTRDFKHRFILNGEKATSMFLSKENMGKIVTIK